MSEDKKGFDLFDVNNFDKSFKDVIVWIANNNTLYIRNFLKIVSNSKEDLDIGEIMIVTNAARILAGTQKQLEELVGEINSNINEKQNLNTLMETMSLDGGV